MDGTWLISKSLYTQIENYSKYQASWIQQVEIKRFVPEWIWDKNKTFAYLSYPNNETIIVRQRIKFR